MSLKRVFVSYSHQQEHWVWDRLVPVLKAGGALVLVDKERFRAGRELLAQMDATQDEADISVLVLTPDYLASDSCLHEMKRAISLLGSPTKAVVPIKRADITIPRDLQSILYVDLTVDTKADQWDLLLRACDVDIGTTVPDWLTALDDVRELLRDGRSVNLLVNGDAKWRYLLDELQPEGLVQVNLEMGTTVSRRGLATEILRALGMRTSVPPVPEDLGTLQTFLESRERSLLALTHFDLAASRPDYGVNLFSTLRYLVAESKRLVLLVQSRQLFTTLFPPDHPVSKLDLQVVELRGRR